MQEPVNYEKGTTSLLVYPQLLAQGLAYNLCSIITRNSVKMHCKHLRKDVYPGP